MYLDLASYLTKQYVLLVSWKLTPKSLHCMCMSYAINEFTKTVFLGLFQSNNVINYPAKTQRAGDGRGTGDNSV